MDSSEEKMPAEMNREEIRISSIQRILNGEYPSDVAKSHGVHRVSIYRWLSVYQRKGWEGLKGKPFPGKEPKFRGDQLDWIYAAITGKSPVDFGMPHPLWTRDAIRKLIRDQFAQEVSRRSIGRVLARWGLDIRRPANGILDLDGSGGEGNLLEEFHRIRGDAFKAGAELFVLWKIRLQPPAPSAPADAQAGPNPLKSPKGLYGLLAVNLRGKLFFRTCRRSSGGSDLPDFIDELREAIAKPLYILLYNPGEYHVESLEKSMAENPSAKVFHVSMVGDITPKKWPPLFKH